MLRAAVQKLRERYDVTTLSRALVENYAKLTQRTDVKALAEQLEGKVEVNTGAAGTTVSITHATFTSRLPTAA